MNEQPAPQRPQSPVRVLSLKPDTGHRQDLGHWIIEYEYQGRKRREGFSLINFRDEEGTTLHWREIRCNYIRSSGHPDMLKVDVGLFTTSDAGLARKVRERSDCNYYDVDDEDPEWYMFSLGFEDAVRMCKAGMSLEEDVESVVNCLALFFRGPVWNTLMEPEDDPDDWEGGIEKRLLRAAVDAVTGEVTCLLNSKALERYEAYDRSCGFSSALESILQESTLRYITVREFFDGYRNSKARFLTEPDHIDLVLFEDGRKYAFEFKRWRRSEHHSVLGKDVPKLAEFAQKKGEAYELVFVANHFEKKQETYESEFREAFGGSGLGPWEFRLISHSYFTGSPQPFTLCVALAKMNCSQGSQQ